MNVDMWYGVFAPPGTSPELVALFNREIREILRSDEVKKAFQTQGMDPASSTPAEFQKLVEADAKRWALLIRRQRITAD